MTATPRRDPGLQPERTALAWQRSALSLAGVSAVVTRLTYASVGPFALVVLGLGLSHAALLFGSSQRAYRSRASGSTGAVPRRLTELRAAAQPWASGVHAALLTGQVVLLGVLVVVDVLRRAPTT